MYYIKKIKSSARTPPSTAPPPFTDSGGREALVAPSLEVTGLDQDLFPRGLSDPSRDGGKSPGSKDDHCGRHRSPHPGFGHPEWVKLLDVSLWHDQALSRVHANDQLTVTHLKANAKALKLNSTSYTSVEIMEQGPVVEEVTVVGLSQSSGEDPHEDFTEFTAPSDLLRRALRSCSVISYTGGGENN